MTRQEVYAIIDTERRYQEIKKNSPTSHIFEDFPLAAGMEAIRYNLQKANNDWYLEKSPYPSAMAQIRKIAAICVQMGEKYGMKEREIPKQP